MGGYLCWAGGGDVSSVARTRGGPGSQMWWGYEPQCIASRGLAGTVRVLSEHLPSVGWLRAQGQAAQEVAVSDGAGSPAGVQGGMRSISPSVVWSAALSIACRAMWDGWRRSTCRYVYKRFLR